MEKVKNNGTIDFVLPWVDNTDSKWNAQREEVFKDYNPNLKKRDESENGECRYRDTGWLKYWFRSVDKFAPWVNKIYFITCGQKPEWLNENHPKLVLVNHHDFIPAAFLPTFNSIPIELNLHRIPELSEQFVLFNDDIFLLNPVSPDFFFKKTNPVLPCSLCIYRFFRNNMWSKVAFNDFCTVNEHFNLRSSIWENRKKWFSISDLGFLAIKNIIRFGVNKTFFANGFGHLSNPQLKSSIQELWSICPEIMQEASASRFRSYSQVNQWLFIAWNLAKGRFYPISEGRRGSFFDISENTILQIQDIILRQSEPQICANDSYENDNSEEFFKRIAQSFEAILPEKSSYELSLVFNKHF